jgi:DNA-binding transcriptional LysR family regulator
MLDLGQVQSFLAVVDHTSFSRAAEALGTSQPVVSQQVKKLETALGQALLVRSHARTLPSEEGRRFLPYARALVRTEARARQSLSQHQLVIAASSNIGTYLLPAVLKSYGSLSSRGIELLVGTNLQTVDALESGTADVALMEWWDKRPGFLATVWRREPLVVITPASHAWARRKAIAKSELFEEVLIGGEPGTGTGTLLQEVFGRSAKRLKVGYQVGSTAAVKEAVKAGLGISIVMASSLRDEVKAGSLPALSVSDGALTKDLYVVTADDQPATSAAVDFSRFIVQQH